MIRNLGALTQRHKWLVEQSSLVFQRGLRDRTSDVHSHVRDHARFKHRTGAAQRGVRTKIVRLASGARMRITNTAKTARWLEFGTRPHEIKAKPGRRLRFFWPKVGHWVSFLKVNHPGTKPYWFMRNAAKHVHTMLGPELRNDMRRIAQRF